MPERGEPPQAALDLSEAAGWDGTQPPTDPSGPRYVVSSCSGRNELGTAAVVTGWSVLDRAYCYREVWRGNPIDARGSRAMERRAQMVCEAMNAGGPVPYWNEWGQLRTGRPPGRPRKTPG